MSKKPS
jgi:hypothetical protein